MRLGLIGDVHAEDERLAASLACLRAEAVDAVLCTGDLVDGHGDVDRACALLRESGARVVRGNHDRWIVTDEARRLPRAHRIADLAAESAAMLRALPPTLTLDVPGGRLLLCHGVGDNDMRRLRPDTFGYDLENDDDLAALLADRSITMMIGGHTHVTMVRTFARARDAPLVVVNPGTLKREDGSGYAIVDLAARHVDFVAMDEKLRPFSKTRLGW